LPRAAVDAGDRKAEIGSDEGDQEKEAVMPSEKADESRLYRGAV
jgi:hypothetical protein